MEGGAVAAPPLIKYPAETTEAFCDGHNAAFVFFDGVPISILYDNTKLAVARILSDGKRQRTRVFMELQSHYLFEDRFGRPGTHHNAEHATNYRSNSGPLWRVAGPRAVYGPLERTKRRTNKRTSKPTQSNLEDRAASAVTEISGVLFFVERRHTGVHSRASAGR